MPKARRPAIRGKPLQFQNANDANITEVDSVAPIEKSAAEPHRPPTRQKRE